MNDERQRCDNMCRLCETLNLNPMFCPQLSGAGSHNSWPTSQKSVETFAPQFCSKCDFCYLKHFAKLRTESRFVVIRDTTQTVIDVNKKAQLWLRNPRDATAFQIHPEEIHRN